MTERYVYAEKDYEALQEALYRSNDVRYARPDQFQYYQNQLSQSIANFLLIPYWESQNEKQS